MIRLIFLLVCFSFAINGMCLDMTSNFQYVFGTKITKAKDFFVSQLQLDLAEAIAKGDTNKMRALVASGADVNYLGKHEMRPLFWALVQQNIKAFRYLLDHGADPNAVVAVDKTTAESVLGLAAGMKDSLYLEELLAHKADPNLAYGYNRTTAIFSAAFYHKTNNIQTLLKYGADINAKNVGGCTPMHDAVGRKAYTTALFLYRAGANPLIRDNIKEYETKIEYNMIDTIRRFGGGGGFTSADRDAYLSLLEELKKHGLIDEEFFQYERTNGSRNATTDRENARRMIKERDEGSKK